MSEFKEILEEIEELEGCIETLTTDKQDLEAKIRCAYQLSRLNRF